MNQDNDTFWTLFFPAYWFFGGWCLTIIAPWQWATSFGIALAIFAVIAFAVFRRTEEDTGKGNGCLGLLLFILPLPMAMAGKIFWFVSVYG